MKYDSPDAAGGGSFTALLLLHTLPYEMAVRASCGAVALIYFVLGAINKQLIDSMTSDDRDYTKAPTLLIRAMYLSSFISLGGLFLGVSNLAAEYNLTFLLFGLLMMLIGGVIQFIRSIFYGGPVGERDA